MASSLLLLMSVIHINNSLGSRSKLIVLLVQFEHVGCQLFLPLFKGIHFGVYIIQLGTCCLVGPICRSSESCLPRSRIVIRLIRIFLYVFPQRDL